MTRNDEIRAREQAATEIQTSGTIEAKVIQVIRTKAAVGSGTEEDPNRYEIKYWSLDGHLLAEEGN